MLKMRTAAIVGIALLVTGLQAQAGFNDPKLESFGVKQSEPDRCVIQPTVEIIRSISALQPETHKCSLQLSLRTVESVKVADMVIVGRVRV